MWTAGFPPSTLSDCSGRIISLHTYMYRHEHTHWGVSGVNSSKATFDSSFFRQPFSLPSRSEIDPAFSQRGQKKSPQSQKFPVKHPSVKNQSVSRVFNRVPISPDFWLNSFHLIATHKRLRDQVAVYVKTNPNRTVARLSAMRSCSESCQVKSAAGFRIKQWSSGSFV